MSSFPVIGVQELKLKQDTGEAFSLLDVREPWETDICLIPGSLKIPLGELPRRFQEVPRDRPVFVTCHYGGRSARATAWLLQNGYQAYNVQGGIAAWAAQIDPGMKTYT